MAGAVSGVLERPSVSGAPDSDSSIRYRPAKFEHHIDNLATIDQVLGTVIYIFGVLALFGFGRFPTIIGGGLGFLLCFIMGWYLRETGEELRKYKLSARTSRGAGSSSRSRSSKRSNSCAPTTTSWASISRGSTPTPVATKTRSRSTSIW